MEFIFKVDCNTGRDDTKMRGSGACAEGLFLKVEYV